MATEKWDDEKSALWVAYANTRSVPKMGLGLLVTLVLLFAMVWALPNWTMKGIVPISFLPGIYFSAQYMTAFISVMTKLNLDTGRAIFFADRKGYRAKIKANPNNPLFKLSPQQNMVVAGVTILCTIGLFVAL
ncbi:MAG: hypothetical protein ORN27_09270 [Rhodoluna sp.]|nr:hypothetical protein [Rhodoluna sp.]